jgi:hypothetical protein
MKPIFGIFLMTGPASGTTWIIHYWRILLFLSVKCQGTINKCTVRRSLMQYKYLQLIILACIICFLFSVIPVAAVKTAEASVSDTLTRGGRFTVTITGLPSSAYYIWQPGTFTMTGEPRDQPPVIADAIGNVEKDSPGGPYTIGSYQYSNGDGNTIRDDVAPSTPAMPNTNYYALVTTDTSGIAVVEFQTSVNTGLRSYSVRVENPRSVDSDNLQLRLQVFTRRAPVVVENPTPEKPLASYTTEVPSVSETIPLTPPQGIVPTTTVIPVQTPAPLRKTPLAPGLTILTAGFVLVIKRRYQWLQRKVRI